MARRAKGSNAIAAKKTHAKGDYSRATGFSQPVHDEVLPGFVDGLRRGLHATYPAPSAHKSALASAPGRHSFASCDSADSPAPPHSRWRAAAVLDGVILVSYINRVVRGGHAPAGRRRAGRHLATTACADDRLRGRHRFIPRLHRDGDRLGDPAAARAGGGWGDAHRAAPHPAGATSPVLSRVPACGTARTRRCWPRATIRAPGVSP